MSNPKIALDALLATSGKMISLYPLNVARYALIELLDSPFLGKSEFNFLNVLPTWYVMTTDIKELKRYNSKNIDELKSAALIASESVNLEDITEFVKIFSESLMELHKMTPEGTEDANKETKGKKVPTGG